MSDPARTAVAVSVLAKSEPARMLVLAWPLVGPSLAARALLTEWARLSGLPVRQVERLGAVLRAHQLCREDRTVDPEATRVVNHVAAAYLRATGGKP
ncbi:MAG: hypothetical protein HMLKMBBP_02112 [Planctomycetes bacterium]|nr:hypothetical protein [Planctomycetota bacterium]